MTYQILKNGKPFDKKEYVNEHVAWIACIEYGLVVHSSRQTWLSGNIEIIKKGVS